MTLPLSNQLTATQATQTSTSIDPAFAQALSQAQATQAPQPNTSVFNQEFDAAAVAALQPLILGLMQDLIGGSFKGQD